MWRFLKWLLIIIVVLIVLIIIAGVVVVNVVNPNDYKGKVETAFNQSTGRTLAIPGNIGWSFFPDIGFTLGKVQINNPEGYGKKAFASIDSAKVSIQLLPLFVGNIAVNTVSLNGVELNLVQKNQTQNNWTFEPQHPAAKPAVKSDEKSEQSDQTADQSAVKAAKQGTESLTGFSVNKLQLTNVAVNYTDDLNKQSYHVKLKQFTASNVSPNRFFPVNVDVAYQQGTPPVDLDLMLKANAKLGDKGVALKDLVAKINKTTVKGDVSLMNPNDLTANVDLTVDQLNLGDFIPEKKAYHFKNMRFTAKNVNLKKAFPLTFAVLATVPEAQVPLNINLKTDATFNPDKQIAALDQIKGSINKTKIWGYAHMNGFTQSKMTAAISANEMDAADYANLQGARLPLTGLKLTADLTSQGFDQKQFPSTLNGKITADVNKAVLKGVDIGDMLGALRNVIKNLVTQKNITGALTELKTNLPEFSGKGKQKKINPNNGKETDIGRFVFNGNVVNGVINNNDLALTGARFRMKGAGQIDLNQERLDYLVYAYGTHFETQNGQQVEVDDDVQLPIKIKGPFDDVRTGIDMPKLVREVQKAVAKSVASEVAGQVKDHVQEGGEKLLKGLKGLFK